MHELTRTFNEYSQQRLADSLQQIEKCVRLLTAEQLWLRFNDVSNAVGNLVLHLNGNVRQWILGGVGGEPVTRDRQAEFDHREPLPGEQILGDLRETVSRAQGVIGWLTDEDLLESVTIQKYTVTKLAAVYHVVEHFSLHSGQIVYATKLHTGRDLSLYDSEGRRIDGRNAGTP